MTTITEREEVILSYFVGLAPVGEEIYLNHKQAVDDCELRHASYLSRALRSLELAKAIRIVRRGYSRRTAVIVVLRRPEAFNVASVTGAVRGVVSFAAEQRAAA